MNIRTIRTGITAILILGILPLQSLAFSINDISVKDVLPQRAHTHTIGEIVVSYKNDSKPFRVVKLPEHVSLEAALATYKKNTAVEYAEPNYIAYADSVPNDTYFQYQWNLNNNPANSDINTEAAWDITTGSPNVVVAVIDTGVAYEDNGRYKKAPDFAGTCFVQGYDFINNDSHPNDDEGHGTHVAGTIAQSSNNNLGVAGVAPDTCIMPVKALDQNGSGSYTAIANAIYYAVDNGADVINMSLGGTASSVTLENAVAYAYNNNVTVIAAAGNDNTSAPHYPSSYNNYVISVGATDYNKNRAYYSNYGADVDIAAPGGDVNVDRNGDGYIDGILQQTFGNRPSDFGYYFYQGTSMASPHVAGVAALLLADGHVSTPDEVRAAIETTAQNIGGQGLGAGLIDAFAALESVSGPLPNQAPIAIAGADQLLPDTDGSGTESVTLNGSASYDSDGAIVSYEWKEAGILISTSSAATLTLPIGTYTYTLTVTDNEGLSAADDVIVTITPNQAPTAQAGADQTVTVNTLVSFDGTGSQDDGGIVSYDWTFGDGSTANGATPSHTYTTAGLYTVTLTVIDAVGLVDSDTLTVEVTLPSPITLEGTAYKVRGSQMADLSWSGTSGTQVDIYRDGAFLTTSVDNGSYTDIINQKGGGTRTYQVCDGNTSTCSNVITLVF